MNYYYHYDKEGNIIQHGTYNGNVEDVRPPENINLGFGDGSDCLVDMNTKQLIQIPPKPGANYKFDKDIFEWCCVDNYSLLRKKEYPPITEQLDMLYHAMKNGDIPIAQAWVDKIDEVKNKYPKEINNG